MCKLNDIRRDKLIYLRAPQLNKNVPPTAASKRRRYSLLRLYYIYIYTYGGANVGQVLNLPYIHTRVHYVIITYNLKDNYAACSNCARVTRCSFFGLKFSRLRILGRA